MSRWGFDPTRPVTPCDPACFFPSSSSIPTSDHRRDSLLENMQTSENTTSTPPLGSDMTNITPTATTTRLVRRGTATTIQDYFKYASFSDNPPSSDLDVVSCPTNADMSSNHSSHTPEQKKYKITAYNGRQLSLGQPERKKIKREATLEHLEEGSQTLRCKKTRAKLANLLDLPLDALFEVGDISNTQGHSTVLSDALYYLKDLQSSSTSRCPSSHPNNQGFAIYPSPSIGHLCLESFALKCTKPSSMPRRFINPVLR